MKKYLVEISLEGVKQAHSSIVYAKDETDKAIYKAIDKAVSYTIKDLDEPHAGAELVADRIEMDFKDLGFDSVVVLQESSLNVILRGEGNERQLLLDYPTDKDTFIKDSLERPAYGINFVMGAVFRALAANGEIER